MRRNDSPSDSLAPALRVCLAAFLVAGLAGCFGEQEAPDEDEVTPPPKVEVENPEGDPAVSAEDGGPGFTGEGWITVEAYPLGDSKAIRGGTIVSRMKEWPGNLRRMGNESNTSLNYLIGDLCYQGLLTLDPNTLEYLPMLASHWKVSEDQMTFTFRIDPRAYWSDGKPVVAEDVVATWKLRMDETILAPSSQLTFGKFEEPVAKSKYILEVKAKEENWRNFLYFSTMSLLPAHVIGDMTGTEYLDEFNYKAPPTTGPYALIEEDIDKPGQTITLRRRDDFWAEDQAWYTGMYNFDNIRFVAVGDDQTFLQRMIKGEIDYYFVVPDDWWAKQLPESEPVEKNWLLRQKIYNEAPNGTRGFALNTRVAPLDDLKVRRALQLLLDRKKMIEKLAHNEYVPMNSYYPGSTYENPDNEAFGYDPAAAVELLEEAGWEEGPDGVRRKGEDRLSLRLVWFRDSEEPFLTTYKEDCRKVGVEIVLERVGREAVWKNLMKRDYQMCSMWWGALVFPNPETSWKGELAEPENTNNITGFENDRVDELFKEYDTAFSQEDRVRIVREIDGLIYKEIPYVLWWYQPCQRVMYWNKFGKPEFGLHRVLEWEDAFMTWWVDPEKEAALEQARKDDAALPAEPLEIRYWTKSEGDEPAVVADTDTAPAGEESGGVTILYIVLGIVVVAGLALVMRRPAEE